MSELTASVDASETLWTVDAVPDPEFGYYTVGSEIVQVIAGFPESEPGYAVGQTFPAKIRVIRATNGTTAASHADGVALTAANAFSGGADVPDPTTGDDDDVVKVASGEYVLGPPSGTVLIRLVEVVVAFDDDLEAGVELVDLAAGEELLSISSFVESAITATVDDFLLAVLTGAEVVCQPLAPNMSFQTLSATIGQRPLVLLAVRGVTVLIKEAAASSGTWTAGSLRVSALVGSLA